MVRRGRRQVEVLHEVGGREDPHRRHPRRGAAGRALGAGEREREEVEEEEETPGPGESLGRSEKEMQTPRL